MLKFSYPKSKVAWRVKPPSKIKRRFKMTKGFYAGSFDPFTDGHFHVVKNAANIFDEVVVGIGVKPQKKRRFDAIEMKTAIEQVISRNNLKNVHVIYFEKLTGDAALEEGATFLIRGLRNVTDYDEEENLALINQEVFGLDTIFVRSGKWGHISSSMVMELLKYGKDVSKCLPEEIFNLVTK